MRKWKLSGKLLLVMTIGVVMLISANVQAENVTVTQGDAAVTQGKVAVSQGKVTYDGYTGGRVGFTAHKPDLKGYNWPWNADRFDRESFEQVIRKFIFRTLHLNKADF
ncbi:hypothetical protein KKA00_09795 [bacterium]|nr:hypothetical protein [bacterium]MBU1652502.1 hypothetical protein [bacterium]